MIRIGTVDPNKWGFMPSNDPDFMLWAAGHNLQMMKAPTKGEGFSQVQPLTVEWREDYDITVDEFLKASY